MPPIEDGGLSGEAGLGGGGREPADAGVSGGESPGRLAVCNPLHP